MLSKKLGYFSFIFVFCLHLPCLEYMGHVCIRFKGTLSLFKPINSSWGRICIPAITQLPYLTILRPYPTSQTLLVTIKECLTNLSRITLLIPLILIIKFYTFDFLLTLVVSSEETFCYFHFVYLIS